jgi:large subunit ribosomal protein L17
MRHRNAGRKFGRNSTSRKAMFRNLVTSVLRHEQVRTTEAKAKEARRFVERVITLGTRAPSLAELETLSGEDLAAAKAARVHAIRQARLVVNDPAVLARVFSEYADRYRARPGGYTRVVKMGARPGDNADMAILQLVRDEDAAAADAGADAG